MRPLSEELAEAASSDIEAILSDLDGADRAFGVGFDSTGSLQDRAEEAAYNLGYEEGRTGKATTWSKPLLSWAAKKRMSSVAKSFEDGKKDGAETRRD